MKASTATEHPVTITRKRHDVKPPDVKSFEPDARTIRWMLDPHTEKLKPWGSMETRYVFVTPKLAALALERNVRNRPSAPAWLRYWRDLISRDDFRLTHQGIAFDTLARLQDGQKRLKAIVDTEKGQWMMVTVGCPPENFPDVDCGKGRSLADTLTVMGVRHAALAGSVCRLIYLYDFGASTGESFNTQRRNMPKVRARDVEAVANQDPGLLETALQYARAGRDSSPIIGSAAGAMCYLIVRANPDHGRDDIPELPTSDLPLTWQFLRGACEGTELPRGDARVLLRNAIPASSVLTKRDNVSQLGMGLQAWYRFASGDPIAVKWKSSSRMPAVYQCPPFRQD